MTTTTDSPRTFAKRFFNEPATTPPVRAKQGPATVEMNAAHTRRQQLAEMHGQRGVEIFPPKSRITVNNCSRPCLACKQLTTRGGSCIGVAIATGGKHVCPRDERALFEAVVEAAEMNGPKEGTRIVAYIVTTVDGEVVLPAEKAAA